MRFEISGQVEYKLFGDCESVFLVHPIPIAAYFQKLISQGSFRRGRAVILVDGKTFTAGGVLDVHCQMISPGAFQTSKLTEVLSIGELDVIALLRSNAGRKASIQVELRT